MLAKEQTWTTNLYFPGIVLVTASERSYLNTPLDIASSHLNRSNVSKVLSCGRGIIYVHCRCFDTGWGPQVTQLNKYECLEMHFIAWIYIDNTKSLYTEKNHTETLQLPGTVPRSLGPPFSNYVELFRNRLIARQASSYNTSALTCSSGSNIYGSIQTSCNDKCNTTTMQYKII